MNNEQEIQIRLKEYLQKNQEKQLETISWFDDRFYKILTDKIEFYPSVTTILGITNKPWLTKWYADLGYEVAKYRSKQAAIKGSLIHESIYRLKAGHELYYEEFVQEVWLQIYNYTLYIENLKPKFLANEMTVFSHTNKIAGTLDELVRIQEGEYNTGFSKPIKLVGGNYVGDIKSGNEDNKTYFKQLSAYVKCVEEMGLCQVDGAFIIYTNSTTKQGWKLEFINKQEIEYYYDIFLACLKVYNDSNTDKPVVRELPRIIRLGVNDDK